jgi:nickel/cobalt transporter (NiCoT) family protein
VTAPPPGAGLRTRIIALYLILAALNVGAWLWPVAAFHTRPLLIGTALLAYTLGLRHAVDADHIAAIDNVTRKLMQEGQRPAVVGFFFSLGHSTAVVLASLAIAVTTTALQSRFAAFLGDLFTGGGLLARLLRPVFRLVHRSWHMYPLGFLFGLGFDTATEIALLSISAAGASGGMPI